MTTFKGILAQLLFVGAGVITGSVVLGILQEPVGTGNATAYVETFDGLTEQLEAPGDVKTIVTPSGTQTIIDSTKFRIQAVSTTFPNTMKLELSVTAIDANGDAFKLVNPQYTLTGSPQPAGAFEIPSDTEGSVQAYYVPADGFEGGVTIEVNGVDSDGNPVSPGMLPVIVTQAASIQVAAGNVVPK